MAKLNSGTRIYGSANVDGMLVVGAVSSNNANVGIANTGSLQVTGGAYISGNTTIGGQISGQQIYINGNNNLASNSANLTTASWTVSNATVLYGPSANTYAPDGTNTVSQLISTNSGSNQCIVRQTVSNLQTNTPYTFSAYLKQGTAPYTQIYIFRNDGSTYPNAYANVNFSTASATFGGNSLSLVNSSFVSVGGGWYRASITINTALTSSVFIESFVRGANADNVLGEYTYFWGAQLEPGYFASQYIPTITTAVTSNNNLYLTGNSFTTGTSTFTGASVDIATGNVYIGSSNTGVTAITKTTNGVYANTLPSVTISTPTIPGGTQATFTPYFNLSSVNSIVSGGTGYTLGDTLTVQGGANTSPITLSVTGVSGGVITSVSVISYGSQYTSIPTYPAGVTGGTGSGATFYLYFGFTGALVTNPGSGYVEQPTITFSGGGLIAGLVAAAYATIGTPTANVRSLATNLSFYNPSGEAFRVWDRQLGAINRTLSIAGGISGVSGPSIGISSAANPSGEVFDFYGYQNSIVFSTGGAPRTAVQFTIQNTNSPVNYLQVTGSTTNNAPVLSATGSDSSVALSLQTKNANTTFNITDDLSSGGAPVASTLYMLGGKSTYGRVAFRSSQALFFSATGTQYIGFYTGSTANTTSAGVTDGVQQFTVTNTSGAANYLSVTGGIAGSGGVLSSAGSDTNINILVQPKGNGSVQISSTANSTSNITGALIVSGGVGVTGNVFLSSANNFYSTTTGRSYYLGWTDNYFTRDDRYNGLNFQGNYLAVNTQLISSGWLSVRTYINNDSGNGTVIFSNSSPVLLQNTVASTSNTTGALVVSGGVGVAGNVYSNSVYTTTTTGAIYTDNLRYAANGNPWVMTGGGGGGGSVTSVSGTGTVSGISLSGTVTSSGNLTLGGALDLSAPPAIGGTTPNTGTFTTLTAQTEVLKGTGENFMFYSQVFQNANWSKQTNVTATDNATTAPDGTNTAASISWGSASNGTGIYQFRGSLSWTGITNTKSIYVRADVAGGTVTLQDPGNTVGISTLTLSTSWQRISLSESAQTATAGVWLQRTASSPSTVYVWGGQLEIGTSAGIYTPTTSAVVYGTPSLSFSGVAGLGLQSDGSLYVSPAGTGAIQAQATTSSATGGNARGANAVDWQTVRAQANQVASGQNSVVGGGTNNVCGGPIAGVLSGGFNTTAGQYGVISGGAANYVGQYAAGVVAGQGNSASGWFNFIGGGYNNSATSASAVTTQATTAVTSGSTSVTLSGSNASIKVGQLISGTGMANFTYVTGISGTSLTLSQNANANGTPTLSFYTPHGVVVGGGNNQATGAYSFIGGGGDAGTASNRNVASGDWSVVGGGFSNQATGLYSVVVGGNQNATYAGYGFVGGGLGSSTSGFGASVLGGYGNRASGAYASVLSGSLGSSRSIDTAATFSSNSPFGYVLGAAQGQIVILGVQTTTNTTTTITTNGAASTTNQIILPNNSAYVFKGYIVANVTGAGDSAGWEVRGLIKRGAAAANTYIVGTPRIDQIAYDPGATNWTISLTADTTNGGLGINVTGLANTTIRWVAKMETTEVTY